MIIGKNIAKKRQTFLRLNLKTVHFTSFLVKTFSNYPAAPVNCIARYVHDAARAHVKAGVYVQRPAGAAVGVLVLGTAARSAPLANLTDLKTR